MPTDIYTKIALTVIAEALSVIAGNLLLNPARASGDCGELTDPCYITIGSRDSLNVWVQNWP